MADDDLDLDLDLDSEPQKPRKTAPPAAEPDAAGTQAEMAPKVMPAHKPGVMQRLLAPVNKALGRIRLPVWNLKTFLVGLLALLVLLLFVENWPPMRLNLLGLHADVPKAVVLVVDFALGFAVAWLVLRRPKAKE